MNDKYLPALRFKKLNEFFDTFLRYSMKETYIKSELMRISKINFNKTLLDFGCGTGTLIRMILDKAPETKIIGVDIDQDILKIARTKLNEYRTQLITYDGRHLPFDDNFFDVVLSSLAIHHIDSARKIPVFAEIRRVIKPGGQFNILDFAKPKELYSKLVTFFLKYTEPIHDNINGKIPAILSESGFTNIIQSGYYRTLFGALTIYSGTKAQHNK